MRSSVIRVAISGACGRMGRQIAGLALRDGGFRLAAALEAPGHADGGRDYGDVLGAGRLGVPVDDRLPRSGVDAVIDFSAPEGTARRVRECAAAGVPVVIGTTGLPAGFRRVAAAAARAVAVVQSANMSTGVNALLGALPALVLRLGDGYDVEIVESHHRHKRDAPSGTALALARAIADALGRDLGRDAVYGRKGDTGERGPREIGIHAVRAGEIAGEHRVILAGPGETLEVVHRAHSREPFARGALRAARFAARARPGLYSMADVLSV